jgi:hypothetical protein
MLGIGDTYNTYSFRDSLQEDLVFRKCKKKNGIRAVKRLGWLVIISAVIVGLVTYPPHCSAEVQCPWLNAATAGGVLGGEVQSDTTNVTPQGDATCHFIRRQEMSNFTLTIDVHTMALPSKDFPTYLAQCGGTLLPLKAVGNEAFQCVSKGVSANGEEQVIGRVRDRAFVLTINANLSKQPTPAKTGLSRETRNVAEQVAGALF